VPRRKAPRLVRATGSGMRGRVADGPAFGA
jgi:hypothetical protein